VPKQSVNYRSDAVLPAIRLIWSARRKRNGKRASPDALPLSITSAMNLLNASFVCSAKHQSVHRRVSVGSVGAVRIPSSTPGCLKCEGSPLGQERHPS